MSASEFYQIFSGFGRGIRDQQDREDYKKWSQDAADLASRQLDIVQAQQGSVQPGGLASLASPDPQGASPAGSTLPTFAQGSDIGAYAAAIGKTESGNRYGIVGPTHPKYGRALGKYQVMESNLPSWSQEAIGRQVSPQEFLASPQIQDAIFQKKFGQSVEKYGNPQDAASVWFTGRPLSQGANARDSLGTTGRKYVDMFTANLQGAGVAPRGQAPQLPATAMQMPTVQPSFVPAPPSRPTQLASADPNDVPIPANAAADYKPPLGPSGGPDPVLVPPSPAPVQANGLPTPPLSSLGGRSMTMPSSGAAPGGAPQLPAPAIPAAGGVPVNPQVASADEANVPVSNAQPAGFQIPPGPQAQAADAPFVPGTVAAPAIQSGRTQDLSAVAGAPRMTPQQAQYLRAQLANPLTRAQAIQAIQSLATPDKWELKEIGGRVVQTNGRGDIRPVPGFDKPVELKTQKGADGNDYTFNPQTGQWVRAIQGKDESRRDLTLEEKQAKGIDPRTFAQVDASGQVYFPGKAATEVNVNQTAEKAQDSKIGGAYGDTFNELQSSGRNAIGQLNTYRLMEKLIENPNFYSGTQSGPLLAARRAAAALGIKDADAAAPNELFAKLATQSVLDKLGGSLGAGVSNSDVITMQNTVANATNTPEGNRQILQFSKALAQRQMDVAKLARQYAGAHGGRLDPGFDDVLADFAEKNPLTVAPTEMQQRQAPQLPQPAQPQAPAFDRSALEAEARRRGLLR